MDMALESFKFIGMCLKYQMCIHLHVVIFTSAKKNLWGNPTWLMPLRTAACKLSMAACLSTTGYHRNSHDLKNSPFLGDLASNLWKKTWFLINFQIRTSPNGPNRFILVLESKTLKPEIEKYLQHLIYLVHGNMDKKKSTDWPIADRAWKKVMNKTPRKKSQQKQIRKSS